MLLIKSLMILQVLDMPTSVTDKLLTQGPLVVALILAVYWLVKRDQKRDEKLDKYISEDRKEMITTIQNNTAAMTEMSKVMEDKREVDNELLLLIRQTLNHK